MKRYYLDSNEKLIVSAVVRMSSNRRADPSKFLKSGSDAVNKARNDFCINGVHPDIQKQITDKLYQSIAYGTPWEKLGETYCGRGMFYQYRKRFCYLIAVNMGIVSQKRQERDGRRA